jgi:hypothetical protein
VTSRFPVGLSAVASSTREAASWIWAGRVSAAGGYRGMHSWCHQLSGGALLAKSGFSRLLVVECHLPPRMSLRLLGSGARGAKVHGLSPLPGLSPRSG